MYEWAIFLQFYLNLNWLKSKKNPVILLKILRKIGPIGYEWATFSWKKKRYLYGSTFKIHGGTSLPNPNLSTPQPTPGLHARIIKCWPNRLNWRVFLFCFFCFVLFVCLFGCCCCFFFFFLVCSSSLYVMIFGWKNWVKKLVNLLKIR